MHSGWQLSAFARHGHDWTTEEEALLTSQIQSGMSIPEVSKLLQRSQTAVHSKALQLGVVKKRKRRSGPRAANHRSANFFLS